MSSLYTLLRLPDAKLLSTTRFCRDATRALAAGHMYVHQVDDWQEKGLCFLASGSRNLSREEVRRAYLEATQAVRLSKPTDCRAELVIVRHAASPGEIAEFQERGQKAVRRGLSHVRVVFPEARGTHFALLHSEIELSQPDAEAVARQELATLIGKGELAQDEVAVKL